MKKMDEIVVEKYVASMHPPLAMKKCAKKQVRFYTDRNAFVESSKVK